MADQTQPNLFNEFESGLLTDYEFYIYDASWGTDAKYIDQRTGKLPTFLFLKGKAVDLDGVLIKEDQEERYKVSDGWASVDGGLTVRHESGNAGKKFNKNSQMAKLLSAVGECAPELIDQWIAAGRTPLEADIWIGTRWFMEEVVEDYKIEGKNVSTSKNYPKTFLGLSDGTDAPQNSESSMAPIMEALTELAKAHESHEDFMNAAIAVPGVTGYSDLVKRIADPDDLYAELRG